MMQSIITTVSKRLTDLTLKEWFVNCLASLAKKPSIDPYSLLPPIPTTH